MCLIYYYVVLPNDKNIYIFGNYIVFLNTYVLCNLYKNIAQMNNKWRKRNF